MAPEVQSAATAAPAPLGCCLSLALPPRLLSEAIRLICCCRCCCFTLHQRPCLPAFLALSSLLGVTTCHFCGFAPLLHHCCRFFYSYLYYHSAVVYSGMLLLLLLQQVSLLLCLPVCWQRRDTIAMATLPLSPAECSHASSNDNTSRPLAYA